MLSSGLINPYLPRYNAFLGFRLGTSGTSPNANGSFVKGYYFWNGYRSGSSAATTGMKTIFFPASGFRNNNLGALYDVSTFGCYWAAVPSDNDYGHSLGISSGYVNPQGTNSRSAGISVRPSQEEQ